jgi:hypothetical protein
MFENIGVANVIIVVLLGIIAYILNDIRIAIEGIGRYLLEKWGSTR